MERQAIETKFEFTLYDHGEHAPLLPQMAELHARAVMDEGGILDFMPPLADSKMLAYWRKYAEGTGSDGNVDIIMALGIPKDYIPTKDKKATNTVRQTSSADGAPCYLPGSPDLTNADEQVLGVMVLADTPYQTRRLHVAAELLLVHPNLRCSGLVSQLVDAGFALAYSKGKQKITFVSQDDNKAARVYRHWGMHQIGVIPNFELSPVDGKPKNMVFWYGNVRCPGRCQREDAGKPNAILWAKSKPKAKL